MKKILVYMSFFLFLIGMQANLAEEDEIVLVAGSRETAHIREQISAHIEENAMDQIEPRHDPVWQFVPGLHGLVFDIQLSYQNMLINGEFDPELMMAQSIPYSGSSEDFRQHRMYKGNENSPYVALLINVAWGGDELSKMLDILDEHHVRASIFFEGKYADNNRELVLDAFNRGHIVGNHSYSHPVDWLDLSYDGFEEEIVRTNEILTSITGEQAQYFAPPGGAFTDETVQAAYNQEMYTILWSADSIDWRGEPANVLVDRVMRRIHPGGLILTHPKPETVIALPEIIERVKNEGYEFRSIDEIVSGVRTIDN